LLSQADNTLFSAMQADYDSLLPLANKDFLPKQVCFKVWVENAVTATRAEMNTSAIDAPLPKGGWVNADCLAVSRTLHTFHTPYCPGQ